MSVKIQINSKAALERLIGEDNELEIEVRNSVIQAFAKSFIKAIPNDEKVIAEIKSLANDSRKAIEETAEREIGVIRQKSYPYKVSLAADTQDLIRREARYALDNAIIGYIDTLDIDVLITERLMEKVDAHINRTIRQKIVTLVETQIAEVLSASLKAAL